MSNRVIAILIIGIMMFTIGVFGSEEEYIGWAYVKIVTPVYKESGKISFEARTEGEIYESVSISVFNKSFSLHAKDLTKLKGFPLQSLIITQEAGYKETGGHTVHFNMKRNNYNVKPIVEELIRISISKGRGLEIHEPVRK